MTLEQLALFKQDVEATERAYKLCDPRDVGWRHTDMKTARFNYKDACADYVDKLLAERGAE